MRQHPWLATIDAVEAIGSIEKIDRHLSWGAVYLRLSEVVIMAIRAPNAIISDMASYTLMGITPFP